MRYYYVDKLIYFIELACSDFTGDQSHVSISGSTTSGQTPVRDLARVLKGYLLAVDRKYGSKRVFMSLICGLLTTRVHFIDLP